MSFVTTVLSEVQKNYVKDWCLTKLQRTFLFLTYLNLNELWTYYQKYVNQMTLNRATL